MQMYPAQVGLLYGPQLDYGGVEAQILALLRFGNTTRWQWQVISPLSERFRQQIENYHTPGIVWQPTHPLLDLRAARQLAHIIQRQNIRLLHIHSPQVRFLGSLAARWAGIPSLVTMHLPGRAWHTAGWRAWMAHYLEQTWNYLFCEPLLYVSQTLYEEDRAKHHFPEQFATFIPNGIDLSAFRQDASPCVEKEKKITFVFTGRLEKQKGLDLLLAALAHIEGNWQLWLFGDGSARLPLQAQARALKLEGRVHFLGYTPDVCVGLKKSHLFVLPSRREGMSLALLEAMATGLPCLVSDSGDNSRLVENGHSGLVFPSGNVSALSGALKQFLATPEHWHEMGKAAQRKAQEFSAQRMVTGIEDCYSRILDK